MLDYSDAQLIAAYLKGDEKAFEILVKRYLKPIYTFIYRSIGNPAEAENITQDVFVKIWKNLKKFNQDKSFKTWIFFIAKNASIDFLRKKKTIPLSFVDESFSEKRDFTKETEQRNILADFKTAIEKLSPNYRAVFLLKYESGLTLKEMAKSLGEPLNTIKSRYHRATLALKKLLVGGS